ncbi:glutaminase [Streptosporangium carneum]|uniref:Glutaminase n=1 Tax=Streptosporangium carneum TaxID=47481 RepID=A0A9W6I0W5_9ACTN|nr:glutaminase [Streptosporangium carneum]GLK09648.1 glutaminase [Streptosporangium carneum]
MPAPNYRDVVDHVMTAVRPYIGEGKVADYIPSLGEVDPNQFGFAVATVDGEVHGGGESKTPFTIESISKLFALALVLSHDDRAIWRRVRREPTGDPFNSLIPLQISKGIPGNPFVNPGAIVVTDQLLRDTGDAYGAIRALLRAETGNPQLHVDAVTAHSEATTGHRDRALAYLAADFGNMLNPVDETLDHYFRQCSIMISCEELARAALFQARHGVRADGSRLISEEDARGVNAIVLTCGTYNAAGEFAYRVGLPCKSGVGGGILAVVPGRCTAVAWGPGVDDKGNSVAAAAALEAFAKLAGLSLF